MQEAIHSLNTLFDQLGIPSTDDDIDQFIADHRPIASGTHIHEAKFWSDSQATTLKQLKDEDADWAIFVDELDTRLRSTQE